MTKCFMVRMMPLRTCGETPPPRAHAFCGQGEDRRADDMSSNNMVKLVSNDGEIFELSELAAQQSITIVEHAGRHRRHTNRAGDSR